MGGRRQRSRPRPVRGERRSATGSPTCASPRPTRCPPTSRFDCIWSNPPIRIGKPALHEMLLRWLARLAPGRLRHPGRAEAPRLGLAAAVADRPGLSRPSGSPRRSGYRILRALAARNAAISAAGSTSMRRREPLGRGGRGDRGTERHPTSAARSSTTSPVDEASRPVAAANSPAPAPDTAASAANGGRPSNSRRRQLDLGDPRRVGVQHGLQHLVARQERLHQQRPPPLRARRPAGRRAPAAPSPARRLDTSAPAVRHRGRGRPRRRRDAPDAARPRCRSARRSPAASRCRR